MIKVSAQLLFPQDSGGERSDLHHRLVEEARRAWWQVLGRAESILQFYGAKNDDLTLEGGSLHLGTASVFYIL